MVFERFFRRIRLSYGITVCNEAKELERLLNFLTLNKESCDEIIVLQDITNRDANVDQILEKFKQSIVVKECLLENDFATFKNNLLTLASGDYLFQIDADEVPKETLIRNLKSFLIKRFWCDCFLVPRINIVNGISDKYLNEWNWKIDHKDRINFPDFQERIFRVNGKIKWVNKVHEKLNGWRKKAYLPAKTEDFCLLHIKDIAKQTSQNEFYKNIS